MKKKDNLPSPGAKPENEPVAGATGESTANPPEKVSTKLRTKESGSPAKRNKAA